MSFCDPEFRPSSCDFLLVKLTIVAPSFFFFSSSLNGDLELHSTTDQFKDVFEHLFQSRNRRSLSLLPGIHCQFLPIFY